MRQKICVFAASILFFSIINAEPAHSVAPQKTLRNLNAALAGETNAALRYERFAARAEQDGYPQVAKLFRATAESESIHRENHRKAIREIGGQVAKVKLEPVQIRSTRENLELPIKGEANERAVMYPKFLREANEEGVSAAVRTFTYARDAEAEHEKLFKDALARLGKNPKMDYFVSKIGGDTVAVPAGQAFAKAESGEYLRVG